MFCESSPVDDSMSGEDAVAHLTSLIRRILLLAVHVYGDEIQHLLEPPPEHGRIRFHRLTIKNASRLEGLTKVSNLLPLAPLPPGVFSDKIRHLLEPRRIQFHRFNFKNGSCLEGLIKMSDLTINPAAVCTPAEYNTHQLDTLYRNFFGALPVVEYCSENNSRSFASPFARCWEDYRKLSPKGSHSATGRVASFLWRGL